MKNILVVNCSTNLSQKIIEFFLDKKYNINLLNLQKNIHQKDTHEGILASYLVNDYSQEALNPEIFNDIDKIIYFTDKSQSFKQSYFENLLNFATNNTSCNNTKYIFDFANYNTSIKELWGAVDDVVMGGVSESQIQLIDNKAVFWGNVSTNNNGGFASARTRNFDPVMNLENYEGIELKVRGDGQRYKFITRCEGTWDGIGYCYSFDTVKDNSQIVRIPFTDLIPVFRAKTVQEADSFNSKQVYSMQLMLSKFEYDGNLNPSFEPGSFRLEVEYIKAYSQEHKPHFILVSNFDNKEVSSVIFKDKLQQENMLRNSNLNYNIIRSYESPEYIADQVFYLQEPNDKNNQAKEKLITDICAKTVESALPINQTLEVKDCD